MYAVTVTFLINRGLRARFLPLMTENARQSLEREPGCLQFDICTEKDSDEIFLYEIYESAEAFDQHLQSDHFKTFDAAVGDMIASKTVRTYDQVFQ